MFNQYSKVEFKLAEDATSTDILALCTNYSLEGMYANNLSGGRSFYISSGNKSVSNVFSIEEAIKLRDWLCNNIEIAVESGYFKPPKNMTIEQVQKELGYKIKIVK